MPKPSLNSIMYKAPLLIMENISENNPNSNYLTFISKKTKLMYSHTVNTLRKLRKMGLIETEKRASNKRIKYILLTEKGKEVRRNLLNIKARIRKEK